MQLNLVVLPGDGVGPEVTAQAVRVLREVANIYGHRFHFKEHAVGGVAIRETGSPLPAATLEACRHADAVLLGAIGSPEFDHLSAPHKPEAGLLQLRRELGGFANLRPVSSYTALAGISPLRSEIVVKTETDTLWRPSFPRPRCSLINDGLRVWRCQEWKYRR